MLFRLKYDIVYADGTHASVATRPATDVAFEQRFDRTITSLFSGVPIDAATGRPPEDPAPLMNWFAQNLRAEWTYFLAWHASRTSVPFEQWIDTVDSIDWQFGGAADPTSPAVPAN